MPNSLTQKLGTLSKEKLSKVQRSSLKNKANDSCGDKECRMDGDSSSHLNPPTDASFNVCECDEGEIHGLAAMDSS